MKTLLLLRHAKSSWSDPGLRDHDRPLNKRGERTAPRMGTLLADAGLRPDRVLCSTAVRARRTAELVAENCGYDGDIALVDDLYMAAPGTVIDVVQRKGGDADRLLVVAHNPGLEQLVAALAGRPERFPTAALAEFRLGIATWDELELEAQADLQNIWRPKELD
jgi:phosphohistidine phosphatase